MTTLADGWYWVRFERSSGELTPAQPALWDGSQWRSVGWSGQKLDGVLFLEACHRPGRDPLQGAANWLCESCDEPDVARIQRHLLIGYNRAARLFEIAMNERCAPGAQSETPPGKGGVSVNAVPAKEIRR